MDTSKMQQFPELTTDRIFGLYIESEENKKRSEELYKALDQAFIWSIISEVVAHYDIGKVTELYEIFGGYVNRSFGIYTEKDGQKQEFFVRLYKKGVTEKEIMFEQLEYNYHWQ